MRTLKILLIVAALVSLALVSIWRVDGLSGAAQAQPQVNPLGARPNGDCVTYGNSSSLQMCLHKFADGTRCVVTGGGGHSQTGASGAGVALQCQFK